MITQVEVFNPRVITSPLPAATDGTEETDPIQIKKIDGLGPVNASIDTAQYGSVDDEFFSGASTGKRNIVLYLALNPDWSSQSYEKLRAYLYKYFMPKSQITLRFTSTHMPQVQIDGYVETFVPNLFEKDADYQVSIICPKAAFVATTPSSVQGTVAALTDSTSTTIEYEGTIGTGFVMDIVADATHNISAGEIRLINQNSETDIWVLDNVANTPDDEIEISTVTGDKYVELRTPGDPTPGDSQMGHVVPGSVWIELEEGTNILQVQSAFPGQEWSMTYSAKYGGL